MRTDILLISHIDSRYDPLINKLSLEIMNEFPTKVVQAVGFIEGSNYNGPIANGDGIYKIYGLQMRRLPKFLGVLKKVIIVIEFLFRVIFHLITSNPKLIYCFNHVSLAGVLPFVIFSKNTKLIYHARELESQQYGFTNFRSFLILKLEKLASKYSTYIVTPSNQLSLWYKNKLEVINVITLLNSPTNAKYIKLNKFYFSNKFGFDKNKVVFIHVGNLTHGRNIAEMINLFETKIKLGVLIFVGKTVDKNYEFVASKEFSNVFYHNNIEYDLLHNYIKRADIGITYIEDNCLSHRLTLGNKFLEYVCAGKAVICPSYLIEMNHLVNKYKIGFLFDKTQPSFMAAIKNSVNFLESGSKIDISPELTWKYQGNQFHKIISNSLSLGEE